MNRAIPAGSDPNNPDAAVWAGTVDPENPPSNMRCAFAKCVGKHETPVHFVKLTGMEGDRYFHDAHFATDAGHRKTHHAECTLVSDFEKEGGKHETLRQAVRENKIILINLNLNPGTSRARRPHDLRGYETEYDRWCKKNAGEYHAVSIRSDEDYQGVMETIQNEGGIAAVDNVMVGYRGKIRSNAQFDLGDDQDKIRHVVEELADHANVIYTNKGYVNGFPVRLTIVPSQAAKNRGVSDMLTARPVISEDHEKHVSVKVFPLIFLRAGAADNAIAEKVLHGNKTTLIALPSGKEDRLNDFKNDFRGAAHNATLEHVGHVTASLGLTVVSTNHLTVVNPGALSRQAANESASKALRVTIPSPLAATSMTPKAIDDLLSNAVGPASAPGGETSQPRTRVGHKRAVNDAQLSLFSIEPSADLK